VREGPELGIIRASAYPVFQPEAVVPLTASYGSAPSIAEWLGWVECSSCASGRQCKRADIVDAPNLDPQRTLGTSARRLLGHVTPPRLGRGDLCAILDGSEARRREVEE
jgi:hypothetical protein